MTPLDAMVKECDEEASLPESLVRRRVKWVASLTSFAVYTDTMKAICNLVIFEPPLWPS